MQYNGAPREGGFCLRRVAKACEPPFVIPLSVGSLSGAAAEDYCAINQQNNRCEAVLDLQRSRACPLSMDTQCGCERDQDNNCASSGEAGLCRTVGVFANRCTYRCGVDDDCPTGRTCTGTSPKHCK